MSDWLEEGPVELLAEPLEAEMVELPGGGVLTLAELHVALLRHLRGGATDECKFLVDLRGATVEANRDEVPLFIEFLRRHLLPWLSAHSSALILLTGNPSAASPLGSVVTAVTNLAEFADRVVVASSFESAWEALPETA